MRGINRVDGVGNSYPAPVVNGQNIKVGGGTSRFRRPVRKEAGVRDVAAEDGPNGLFSVTTDLGKSCDQTAVRGKGQIPSVNAKSGILIQLSRVDLKVIGTSDRSKSGFGGCNGRPSGRERNGGKPRDGSSTRDTFKNRNLVLRASLPEAGLGSVANWRKAPSGVEAKMTFRRGPLVGEGVERTRIMGTRLAEPATVPAQAFAPDMMVSPVVGPITEVDWNGGVVNRTRAAGARSVGGKKNPGFLALAGDCTSLLKSRLGAGNGGRIREADMDGRLRRALGHRVRRRKKFLPSSSV